MPTTTYQLEISRNPPGMRARPASGVSTHANVLEAVDFISKYLLVRKNEIDCNETIRGLHDSLSKEHKTYFAAELWFRVDGVAGGSLCYVLAEAQDYQEALVKYLERPRLEAPPEGVATRSGHFVEVRFEGDALLLTPILGATSIAGGPDLYADAWHHAMRRLRQRRMTTAPSRPPPAASAGAVYWANLVEDYQIELARAGVLDAQRRFARQYAEADAKFGRMLAQYERLKVENAERQREHRVMSLLIQGLSSTSELVSYATSGSEAAAAAAAYASTALESVQTQLREQATVLRALEDQNVPTLDLHLNIQIHAPPTAHDAWLY